MAVAAAVGVGGSTLEAGAAALLPTATAAALLPAAAARAAQPDPGDLLDRHRPVLRYDSQERRFAVSVAALTGASEIDRARGDTPPVPAPGFLGARYADGPRAGPGDRLVPARDARPARPLVYGRAVRDAGVASGSSTGSSSPTTRRTAGSSTPAATPATGSSFSCAWPAPGAPDSRSISLCANVASTGRPVVYVANGSHALYPRAGGDEADGRGRRARPPVEHVSETEPRWMAWPGRWGEDEAGWVPGEQPSPRGPAFQPDRWNDPGRFHATEARECGAGPPGRPWQTILTIVLVVAVAAAALRAARRSYNRRP